MCEKLTLHVAGMVDGDEVDEDGAIAPTTGANITYEMTHIKINMTFTSNDTIRRSSS